MEKDHASGQTITTGPSEETEGMCVKDSGFLLSVSDDKLEAYICPKKELSSKITFEDVKALLKGEGIEYGIDEGIIEEYVAIQPVREYPFKIAQGKAAEPGQDAKVEFHFDINPLKIGTISESGHLDYKDRGKIVQVKEGSLIAEKIPAKDGMPGIDVYGKAISFSKPKDIKFLCGKDAEKSEDGLRIFAKIDGRPEISDDGKISVSTILQIAGDINLKTGHVDFNGDIEVRGCVQDGFRVKGRSLKAEEILRAEIDIAGDIVVSGGIIGANIKAGGGVSALYIHNGHVQANGDINVEREVFHSTLETNQKCNVLRGRISSSSVFAKKGIMAREIGSKASSPCTVSVGIDTIGNNKINHISDQISKKKDEQKNLENLVAGLQQEIKDLDNELESLPQEEDQARLQQMTLQKTLEECQKRGDLLQIEKVEEALRYLDSKIKQVYETMDGLLGKQDEIQIEINEDDQKIRRSRQEVEELGDKASEIAEFSKSEKGISEVRVSGIIYAHTRITGAHSSCTLVEDHQHVLISEAKIVELDQPAEWRMNIYPFR